MIAVALVSLGALGSGIATGPRLLAARRRCDPALLRRLDECLASGAPARLSARRTGAVDRRRTGDPRAGQRDEEPLANRFDRLRADDRPRAGHVRGDFQPRHPQLVRGRRRPALHRRLRAHLDEHIHGDRGPGRQVAHRQAGHHRRDARFARAPPTTSAATTTSRACSRT